MTYNLGPVKPWVKDAAYALGPRFGIASVLGWGTRSNPSEHPKGLALDFMTTSKTTGDKLAAEAVRTAGPRGITYVIWRQRIWSLARSSEGWRPMADRGSPTANHMDHVHVSFQPTAPTGFTGAPLPAPLPVAPSSQPSVRPDPGQSPARIATSSRTAQQSTTTRSSGDPATTVEAMVLTGAALVLGGVLIVLGVARASQPVRDSARDATVTLAQFVPQTRAAATALKGTS